MTPMTDTTPNTDPLLFPSPCTLGEGRVRAFPRGFTLVELLVVIGIIVILMSILLPVLSNVRKKAAITAQKMDFQVIGSALEQYKSDFNVYPLNSGFALSATGQYTIGPLAAAMIGPGPAVTDASNHNGDGKDGPGFIALGRKVYGPYLTPDKFAIAWLPNGNGSILVPFILDHWGTPIEYFPVYNPPIYTIANGTAVNRTLIGSAANGGAVFDQRDSISIVGSGIGSGTAQALLYKLGVTSIGANSITPPETLASFNGYLLISAGPDGLFTNLANAGSSDPSTYINRADDVYNFEN